MLLQKCALPRVKQVRYLVQQPLGLNQLKSNDDYGIRHECIALIILGDIYLAPQ